MGVIKVTPEELRDAATFLGQRLEAITSEVNQLKGKIDEISGNWEGAAKSSFIATFESDMLPVMTQTLPQVIEGIESQLNGAADAVEQTDEQIASAFRG